MEPLIYQRIFHLVRIDVCFERFHLGTHLVYRCERIRCSCDTLRAILWFHGANELCRLCVAPVRETGGVES